ncbi:MAG: hypothetical protein H6963_07495 [Chromatiaceae bacterium]|nr:hypothetical protein [Chromatiaceae bacterium]
MRDVVKKNTLIMLIVLAIALLPIRFGHAVGVDDRAVAVKDILSHLDMHGCNPDESTHAPNDRDNYSTSGSFTDDCCGDQCSTAQTLLPNAFNLNFSSSCGYDLTWSEWLPEHIVTVEYRPPIILS